MPKKILAVDDEQHILRLIKVNLERAGYDVVTALDGKDALEKVEAEKPDLLVLDAEMPGLNSLEVLQSLRKSAAPRELPVIMLTSRRADAGVYGRQSGVDLCLPKPFNPMELISFVMRIFSSQEWSEAGTVAGEASSDGPTRSSDAEYTGTAFTTEGAKQGKIYALRHRRQDEWVRQPILRLLRRLRGLPPAKVTVDQAIELTRDYLVNVKGFPESFREIPLEVTSEMQYYQLRLLGVDYIGYDKIKVDMADGKIDYVEASWITM